MNIYQRLSKITNELSNIAKNLEVGTGRNKYNAVGEADVLAAVKPLEAQYGVYSYPAKREVIYQDVLESEKEYQGKVTKSSNFFMRVETTYRFVNMDKPEEYVDMISYGDGVDSRDKAPGKAVTYSDKYSLLKAYKIITGDDPDQHQSKPHKYDTAPQSTSHAKITLVQKDKIVKGAQDGVYEIKALLQYYKVNSVDELNYDQANEIIKKKLGGTNE